MTYMGTPMSEWKPHVGVFQSWSTTMGGIQVTLIDGKKYATLFDLREGFPGPSGERMRINDAIGHKIEFLVGPRAEQYDLPSAQVVRVLPGPKQPIPKTKEDLERDRVRQLYRDLSDAIFVAVQKTWLPNFRKTFRDARIGEQNFRVQNHPIAGQVLIGSVYVMTGGRTTVAHLEVELGWYPKSHDYQDGYAVSGNVVGRDARHWRDAKLEQATLAEVASAIRAVRPYLRRSKDHA